MTAEATADVELQLGGRRVRVSTPDRILWPRTGFTKLAMIDYYAAIAPVLLPHLRGRGITMARYPEGVDGPGWFQANCRGRPPWMRTYDVEGRRGETFRYCMVDDVAGLVWMANLGTVEVHPFLATVDRPDEPSFLVFDLDPGPPASIVECCRLALVLRDVLAADGLATVVKTSGGAGLHVYVPLASGHTFARTKAYARAIADVLAARRPDLATSRIARRERAGRVFVDWVQNDASRSTVAAYSLRAMPWPLVSTPVTWSEVEAVAASGRAERLYFGPAEVLTRVDRFGDLFAAALEGTSRLPGP